MDVVTKIDEIPECSMIDINHENGCQEVLLNDLIGKQVVVETQETVYAGKLVEISEEEVHLESESGWIVIPVDRIATIREKD